MLEQAILDQLKGHFSELNCDIGFLVYPSSHAKQEDLEEMLSSVSSCSGRISISYSSHTSEGLRFDILREGQSTGITFRGIPGGHEFNSFILAILNTAGIGKFPDSGISKRIKGLKGPKTVTTYVSLSCENCPNIVQSLNQIALINPGISHHMVDGDIYPEEVSRLKLSGVPAVIIDGDLVFSGRGELSDLIDALEDRLGSDENALTDEDLGTFDITVIGAGPAGVAAAIYSARKGLKTAIVADKLGGQVRDTKGIENLIGISYTEGPQLTNQLKDHLLEYPVELLEHRRVVSVVGDSNKKISLSTGEFLRSDSIIVATGAKWKQLNVVGEKEYLGRGVAYCPHCDGPFFKDRKVAVVGGGNSGVEAAIDLAGICSEVVLFEYSDRLNADSLLIQKLESLPNVRVITSAAVQEVKGDGKAVSSLVYRERKSGEVLSEFLSGIFVQIGLSPNSNLGIENLDTNRFGEIIVDEKSRTNIKGIYAAGDVTTVPYKQIVVSMGDGAKAALAAFEDRMRSIG